MKKTIELEKAYDNLGSVLTEPVIFRSFELVPASLQVISVSINLLSSLIQNS